MEVRKEAHTVERGSRSRLAVGVLGRAHDLTQPLPLDHRNWDIAKNVASVAQRASSMEVVVVGGKGMRETFDLPAVVWVQLDHSCF
mmetsp:Transcript_40696/g.67591  ORF Transcript_40696/g.67591 Transcript_40696/m.67591 type:complete len:86 (+) Transcript_40696:46-303(+)